MPFSSGETPDISPKLQLRRARIPAERGRRSYHLSSKWVQRERGPECRRTEKPLDVHVPAFVPVVELAPSGAATCEALPASTRREAVRPSHRPPLPSRLVAQLPNGVSLELECGQQDTALLTAMIDALRSR